MGRSHPRAFNRVAGKTWRFARNRCPRKRIGQFPAFDAHLLSDLWYSVSGANRIRFARHPARSQCRLCHHRLHPRERRKILSLSTNDPFSELEIALSQTTRVNERSAHRRRLPRHELWFVQSAATLDRSSQLAVGRRSRFRKSLLREANNVRVAQSIPR
jgi:hypothetical protein